MCDPVDQLVDADDRQQRRQVRQDRRVGKREGQGRWWPGEVDFVGRSAQSTQSTQSAQSAQGAQARWQRLHARAPFRLGRLRCGRRLGIGQQRQRRPGACRLAAERGELGARRQSQLALNAAHLGELVVAPGAGVRAVEFCCRLLHIARWMPQRFAQDSVRGLGQIALRLLVLQEPADEFQRRQGMRLGRQREHRRHRGKRRFGGQWPPTRNQRELPERETNDMASAVAEQLAVRRLARIEFVGARRQPGVQLVVAGKDAVGAARPQAGETRVEQPPPVDTPFTGEPDQRVAPALVVGGALRMPARPGVVEDVGVEFEEPPDLVVEQAGVGEQLGTQGNVLDAGPRPARIEVADHQPQIAA